MKEKDIKLLEEYGQWLYEHGYTDDDIWAENPTALSRFIASKEQNE